MIGVFDMAKGDYVAWYSSKISPKRALINAYAQLKKKDFSTWLYEERYGHLVEENDETFTIGDLTVMKNPRHK